MRRWLASVFSFALLASECGAADATFTFKPNKAETKPPAQGTTKTETSNEPFLQPDTVLVDAPTSAVLDYGGYSTRTRFFSNGGVMEWLDFGVFQRLNIGASLNTDRVIGTSNSAQVTRPELQMKYRFYDGDSIVPAFAIGFDGQGYLYNRPALRYNQRQRGLYLVGSQEVVIPGLQVNGGANISDFTTNAIFGTLSASYNIRDKVLLMAEWDNIKNYVDSRVNLGVRVYITPAFHLDFAARGVGQGGTYDNGVQRGPERIVNFKYTGNF